MNYNTNNIKNNSPKTASGSRRNTLWLAEEMQFGIRYLIPMLSFKALEFLCYRHFLRRIMQDVSQSRKQEIDC